MSSDSQQITLSSGLIKDAIVVLTFLASIAGLYVKMNEQIVKLEIRVEHLERQAQTPAQPPQPIRPNF